MLRRLLLACTFVLVWPAAAWAQPVDRPVEDQIVLSGSVQVPRGRAVGEIVVFRGSAVVAGVAHGDVVVLSGEVTIAGQVAGTVVAVDGSVLLREGAQVGGDVIAGGDVSIEPGAEVAGTARRFVNLSLARSLDPLGGLLAPFAIAFSSLLFGLAIWVVAPSGADRVASATRSAPLGATTLGLAIWVLVPVLAVAITVTILGIPAGLAVLLGLGLLAGVGYTMGVWSLGRFVVPAPRSRAGAFFAGWATAAVLGLVPFLNVAWWIVATAVGLGATVLAAWRVRTGGRHRRGRIRRREPASSEPIGPAAVVAADPGSPTSEGVERDGGESAPGP